MNLSHAVVRNNLGEWRNNRYNLSRYTVGNLKVLSLLNKSINHLCFARNESNVNFVFALNVMYFKMDRIKITVVFLQSYYPRKHTNQNNSKITVVATLKIDLMSDHEMNE